MGESSFTCKPDLSIKKIGELLETYITTKWKKVLEENFDELSKAFPELEDATYGLYLDKLMPPMFEALEKTGFTTLGDVKESDFIIGKSLNFSNSMEKWGPEDNRSRVFWIVVKDQQKKPIGTLLFDFFHSHIHFEVPSAPQIFALEETSKENIILAIRRMKEGD